MTGRCTHCRRRTGNSTMTITKDGASSTYCGDRAECRRAGHEAYGDPIPASGASTEALGAALIAGDYAEWPWWARRLPRSARDRLRGEFAERMAAGVEYHVRRAVLEEERDD